MISLSNHYIWFVLLALMFSWSCAKDEPSSTQGEVFIKTFGGAYQDEIADIIEVEGNYFLVGNIKDATNNNTIRVIRTDAYGNKIWTENYKVDQKQTIGNQIIKLNNSNQFAIIGGVENDTDSLYFDIYLLIIDADGVPINQKIYENPYRSEIGKCIIELEQGGFVISATSENVTTTTIDSILFFPVTNTGDEVLPNKTGIKGANLYQISKKFDNTGFLLTAEDGNNKPLVIALQADGTTESIIKIGINGIIYSVAQNNNGKTYLCGTQFNGENGNNDGFIAEYDNIIESPDYNYLKSFGASGDDNFSNLVITNENQLLVTGSIEDLVLGTTNIWVSKYELSGQLISESQFGGDNSESGIKILESDNNSFVVGCTIFYGKNSMLGMVKSSF